MSDFPHLRPEHLKQLLASAITPEIIAERGYRTETSSHFLKSLEARFSKAQLRVPALILPVFRLGQPTPHAYFIRPDQPRHNKQGKAVKYEAPKGVPSCFDVLPRFRTALKDPTIELWITEGAKKADSLASLGIAAISLNGVYGWRSKNALAGKLASPDFEEVAWNGRHVVLAFDSDVIRNAQVQGALKRLSALIGSKGASVTALHLPHDDGSGKTGVDDFLAALPEEDRLSTLRKHLEPSSVLFGIPQEVIGTHPTTGQKLLNPPNYVNQSGVLAYVDPVTGKVRSFFTGYLAVVSTGLDRETGEETMTVAFDGLEQVVRVTAARAKLSTGKGVIEVLAGRGAPVHEKNARQIAAFLVEFARQNGKALPRVSNSTTYGFLGETILGPTWSVGAPAEFTGLQHIEVRTDREA